MLINGVVTAKLQHLQEVLTELQSLGPLSVERLQSDWLVRRAVERDLQIAVEVMIDVCHRVLALRRQPPPPTARAALKAAQQIGMLLDADKYRPLVGFRNLLVHEYEEVRLDIVVAIVNDKLGDLTDFRDEVMLYVTS